MTTIGKVSSRKKSKIKILLDIFISLIGLIILFPLFFVISIFIKLNSKGPMFFKQDRLGYKGSTFKIYKLRTMVDKAWKKGTGLYVTEEDERITKIGKYLRKFHIDEIPQLINILRGEMSLIGPRAAIPNQYNYYEEWEKERLDFLPGVTGWAQINGANVIDWDERIKMDVWYVKNWSLKLDFYITLKTVEHILLRVLGRKKDAYPINGPVWKRERPDNISSRNKQNS